MTHKVTIELTEKTELPNLSPGTILAGYRGSIAHGMYVPPEDLDSIDDIDFMSIIIAPVENYLGLTEWGSRGTKERFEGRIDLVEYELRKFVSLLLKGNPNVVSLLWLKPEFYVHTTELGNELILKRDLFVSKAACASFCGYAQAQLSKMGKIAARGFRGEKRKELVDRYGFDTKNAAHCIRLLRMCLEYLKTGTMVVDRTGIDADELLGVKKGKWSFDRVSEEARALFNQVKEAKASSPLPEEPNYVEAEKLCVKLIEESLYGKETNQ